MQARFVMRGVLYNSAAASCGLIQVDCTAVAAGIAFSRRRILEVHTMQPYSDAGTTGTAYDRCSPAPHDQHQTTAGWCATHRHMLLSCKQCLHVPSPAWPCVCLNQP
jgi:hypothetical protein